jgi:hypothetical protein
MCQCQHWNTHTTGLQLSAINSSLSININKPSNVTSTRPFMNIYICNIVTDQI